MRCYRIFPAFSAFLILCALPSAASAKVAGLVEIEALAGIGGPIALIGASSPGGLSTEPVTAIVAGRIGFPDYSLLRLEISGVIPNGMGINLLLDVFQYQRVRVHLLDPGVFWNLGKPVTAAHLPRKMDLTVGAGCDVKLVGNWSVALNWRWFIPNPITVIPDYDSFSYPAYREAARGGQLWATASYTW